MSSEVSDPLGRLAGGIAHDFNNLLTVILSYSDVLLMSDPDRDPEERELIGEIRKAAERGAAMTGRLLAFSRRHEAEARELDSDEILQAVRGKLARRLREGMSLVLLGRPAAARLRADPTQIDEALTALVANAEAAMPGGGRILLGCRLADLETPLGGVFGEIPAGRYCVFSVEDEGVGLGEEDLGRAIDPFFTTRGSGRGTGLGLATARAIAAEAGGFLDARSRPGRGSRFELYLPHQAGSERQASAEAGPTLLLVEDNPLLGQARAAELAEAGYRMLLAENLIEARRVAASRDRPVDLLICDWREARSAARLAGGPADEAETARLYLCGSEASPPLAPGEHVLERPFESRELLAAIRRALEAGA